jgi:hypothetical protein
LALAEDVTHGFFIPVPPKSIPLIAGALVQSFSLAQQFTLNKLGDQVVKYCFTQDLSFLLSREDCSVNLSINMSKHNEMIYGWCISRLLHFIVSLCLAYPKQGILIAKYNYSNAYRCMVYKGQAAAQSIMVFNKLAYIALHLTLVGHLAPQPGASSAKW